MKIIAICLIRFLIVFSMFHTSLYALGNHTIADGFTGAEGDNFLTGGDDEDNDDQDKDDQDNDDDDSGMKNCDSDETLICKQTKKKLKQMCVDNKKVDKKLRKEKYSLVEDIPNCNNPEGDANCNGLADGEEDDCLCPCFTKEIVTSALLDKPMRPIERGVCRVRNFVESSELIFITNFLAIRSSDGSIVDIDDPDYYNYQTGGEIDGRICYGVPETGAFSDGTGILPLDSENSLLACNNILREVAFEIGFPCPTCGDGFIEGNNEGCDDGANNSNTSDACRTNCKLPFCGDGIVDINSGEQCDTGEYNSCLPKNCGNGVIDCNEECDDGSFTCNSECLRVPVPAGTYTIEMYDSYGDGWQTTGSLGGRGLQVTLFDVNGNNIGSSEFGLCSSYAPTFVGCIQQTSYAVTQFIVPAGVANWEWFLPGDSYGEIGIKIIAPNGLVIYDDVAPATVGVLPL